MRGWTLDPKKERGEGNKKIKWNTGEWSSWWLLAVPIIYKHKRTLWSTLNAARGKSIFLHISDGTFGLSKAGSRLDIIEYCLSEQHAYKVVSASTSTVRPNYVEFEIWLNRWPQVYKILKTYKKAHNTKRNRGKYGPFNYVDTTCICTW